MIILVWLFVDGLSPAFIPRRPLQLSSLAIHVLAQDSKGALPTCFCNCGKNQSQPAVQLKLPAPAINQLLKIKANIRRVTQTTASACHSYEAYARAVMSKS